MSLRGAPSRYPPKKLPHVLVHGRQRYELPEELANRLLCDTLAQLAWKKAHALTSRPDPIVSYSGHHYRLVGDLLEGTLYAIKELTPQYHVEGGELRRASFEHRWRPDLSVTAVSAIETVSYVMEEPRRARQEALIA